MTAEKYGLDPVDLVFDDPYRFQLRQIIFRTHRKQEIQEMKEARAKAKRR